jgi:hypothetical protein
MRRSHHKPYYMAQRTVSTWEVDGGFKYVRSSETYHRFAGDKFCHASVARSEERWGSLQGLSISSINLLHDLSKCTHNAGGMAINDWCVANADLSCVIQNHDECDEGERPLCGIVIGIRDNVSTTNIRDREVPNKNETQTDLTNATTNTKYRPTLC